MDKNYYSILGLQNSASLDEIEEAYHRLSRENSYGISSQENIRYFIAVKEAYNTLSNETGKLKYDYQVKEMMLRVENRSLLKQIDNINANAIKKNKILELQKEEINLYKNKEDALVKEKKLFYNKLKTLKGDGDRLSLLLKEKDKEILLYKNQTGRLLKLSKALKVNIYKVIIIAAVISLTCIATLILNS